MTPGRALVRVSTGERLVRRIVEVRGHRVMVDADLAALYGVRTTELSRGVRRNATRFPSDFAFRLTAREFANLRYQIGTSSGHGGRRYLPTVFTEQGVAMLSSVLGSPKAVQVNIEIMRAFVRMRELAGAHADVVRRLDALEHRYDTRFRAVFDAIRRLVTPAEPPRRHIGFTPRDTGPHPKDRVQRSARRFRAR